MEPALNSFSRLCFKKAAMGSPARRRSGAWQSPPISQAVRSTRRPNNVSPHQPPRRWTSADERCGAAELEHRPRKTVCICPACFVPTAPGQLAFATRLRQRQRQEYVAWQRSLKPYARSPSFAEEERLLLVRADGERARSARTARRSSLSGHAKKGLVTERLKALQGAGADTPQKGPRRPLEEAHGQ